jgi:hypothetical protein
MVADALVDRKVEASERLAKELVVRGSPLLAAYWDFREDAGQWTLVLVPTSSKEEQSLIEQASNLLVERPYRSVFSLSDPAVDSGQIERARALGAYIRIQPYIGRRIDTTFTGGQYFESVIPVYFAPGLVTHLSVA